MERAPRFVFASDSLKGTLSSADTACLLGAAAERHFPGCSWTAVPMADGGEGTAEDPGSLPLIELMSDNSQEDT